MALDTRAAAARVLAEVLSGSSLNQALPRVIGQVNPRDRGLLQQLCYGSLRQGPRSLALLQQLLDKPLRDKDRDITGLLLCGLYQLDNTRIPDHAAVAATVGATRALKKNWAKGMSNAVLRRYLREREELSQALDEAATAAHPEWLYRELYRQWPEHAPQIIAANNQQPPMTLRVNSKSGSRDDYLANLNAQGMQARAGELCAESITLEQARDVQELPGFGEGEVSVQDEAAQLAAHLLAAQPGDRILDACAAPGGKSCHILELQPELDELVAMDVDEQRLQKIADNLTRLKLKAELICGNATRPPSTLEAGSFDRILVDAPCSASGVIRRHPDVKLLRRFSDIEGFAVQQLAILNGLWPLLKPGGRLLYATCSVLEQENSQVVERFLQEQPDGQGRALPAEPGQLAGYGRQLLPSASGGDGLFYAMLEKTG